MRLIDADVLEELFREVIGGIAKRPEINGNLEHMIRASAMVVEMIKDAPTINPQPHWIPCSERLPEELVPVNITWVNHEPESYYEDIKDKPFSATGIYYRSKWWWYSATAEDVLAEYGRSEFDRVSDSVEIIAWQPLPSPYREEADQ